MEKCPRCKDGKVHVKSIVYGTGETTEMDLDCPTCDGTGEVSKEQMEVIEYENQMWCECEDPTFGSYPEDGQCQMQGCRVHKHHVHCGTCGKISQVG